MRKHNCEKLRFSGSLKKKMYIFIFKIFYIGTSKYVIIVPTTNKYLPHILDNFSLSVYASFIL